MKLVVVESPAKAKTINGYLGSDYRVIASLGHVRDLSPKEGSVKPDEDFDMVWSQDDRAQKAMGEISKAAETAEIVFLATDPDREGEAISWHIYDLLKKKKTTASKPIRRVAFHEITKEAVQSAIRAPRDLDDRLIEAYLARRALDYLVGYTISPVLWRKLPSARSAGRVQSVALRLICEREEAIQKFKSEEYWSITGVFKAARDFEAQLFRFADQSLKKMDIPNQAQADHIVETLKGDAFRIVSLEKKETKRYPAAPFTTSTLQQEASLRLRLGAKHTMSLAQALYEQGFITYMRTDAVNLAASAIEAIRKAIPQKFGPDYLPPKAILYKTKQKNAQEAHEAIRTVDIQKTRQEVLPKMKDPRAADLYDLIWKRTVASQMQPARFENTTAVLESPKGAFRASGVVPLFDGFLRVYADPEEEESPQKEGALRELPPLEENKVYPLEKLLPQQHFTHPPARFGEASLVKELESLGIGRPSTYASILSVLQDRAYVRLENRRFFPENKGVLVTAFLKSFFGKYVAYDYTAQLEDTLDSIAGGQESYKEFLRAFWGAFKVTADGAIKEDFEAVRKALEAALEPVLFPDGADKTCPGCRKGTLGLQVGRYGPYLSCSRYPDCQYRRSIHMSTHDETSSETPADFGGGPRVLGTDPASQKEVTVRNGPFGFYCQLGESPDKNLKPKRATLPKPFHPETITLQQALELLALPRVLGTEPTTNQTIETNYGRFGPYIKVGATYVSLKADQSPLTLTQEEALQLYEERGKSHGGRLLGPHPDDNEDITIKTGFYGPYVQHGKQNASIPKSMDSSQMTLQEAVELLKKKAAAGKSGPRRKGFAKKKAPKAADGKKKPKG